MSSIELLNSIVACQSQYWANFFSFLGMDVIHGNSTGTQDFIPMVQDNIALPLNFGAFNKNVANIQTYS